MQVVEPWLAITCWCERHVVQVEQAIFREFGVTYSCGADDCAGPDGDRSLTPTVLNNVTDVMVGSGMERDGGKREFTFGAATVAPLSKPRRAYRTPKPTRPRRRGYVVRYIEPYRTPNRTPREVVAARRDRVEQMYKRGMKVDDIAAVLDEPFHTARNDVAWLRRHGRVS